MKLFSHRVYTASGCKAATIGIEDGRIVSVIEGVRSADAVDYGEMRIIPGIFDTHNHGTSGFDLMDTGGGFAERKEVVRGYLKGLAAQGTVNIFPTVSDPEGIRAVAEVARETVDGANVLGIHSEGPGSRVWGRKAYEPHGRKFRSMLLANSSRPEAECLGLWRWPRRFRASMR